jgi:hypothetical protein
MTLGLNFKLIISIFDQARHHLISGELAQGTHKFLTPKLSACISSWPIHTVHASVPEVYAQHVWKGPFQIWIFTFKLSIGKRN